MWDHESALNVVAGGLAERKEGVVPKTVEGNVKLEGVVGIVPESGPLERVQECSGLAEVESSLKFDVGNSVKCVCTRDLMKVSFLF
jgi:hypothetical protein